MSYGRTFGLSFLLLMSVIYALDLIGTLVFAISGVLAAIEKRLDIVGALVLGFVTAVGGGTLRDLLIGRVPVGWMQDLNYLWLIILALPLCYLWRTYIQKLRKGLFLFDTIGLGIFTILGVEHTLAVGLHPILAVLMGVVSASFGGVIRDVLSNEIPLIFRKEIYALPCAFGGLTYLLLKWAFPSFAWPIFVAVSLVILIRYLAVRLHWALDIQPRT